MTSLRFRSWLPLEKRMVDADNVEVISFKDWNFEGGMSITVRSKFDETDETYQSEPLEFKLMQSTGLKDKNGVEIFEGDILDKTNYCNFDVEEKVGKVEMGEGYDSDGYNHQKWLGWKAGDSSLLDVCEASEIIGNIYENPDLLPDQS